MSGNEGLLVYLSRFPDEAACIDQVVRTRWVHTGPVCPACGDPDFWGLGERSVRVRCRSCGAAVDLTEGTVLQDTKLPLRTWFLAAYLLDTDRRSYTVAGLARVLGIGPEAARGMRDRVALALASPEGRRMFGLVREEVHEEDSPPHTLSH